MAFIKASGRSDFTTTAAEAAEYVTGTPALALLHQSGLLPSPPANVELLDNASGAGILTSQLLSHASPPPQNLSIVCSDLDLAMIDFVQGHIQSKGWTNVTARHADSHHTKFADAQFSHVLMNFGPQLMKDPEQMLRESLRILKPGGVLGFTTWMKPGFIESMKAVFPDYGMGATPLGGGWGNEEFVSKTIKELKVEDVKIENCNFQTEGDADGYLELFINFLGKPFFDMKGEEGKSQYAAYMKEPGRMKMSWTAMVVTARKAA